MLESALIIALVVLFIHACTWDGMLFSFIHKIFWDAPSWVKKPLFDCPVCMTFWWGLLIIFLTGVLSGVWPADWFGLFITLFAAGGANVIFSSIIKEDDSTGSDHE